jgi:hypothetical protein
MDPRRGPGVIRCLLRAVAWYLPGLRSRSLHDYEQSRAESDDSNDLRWLRQQGEH